MIKVFLGNFDISVTYSLTNNNEIVISYAGICDKDTVVNMTNHSYFNLYGHDSKDGLSQNLWINSSFFIPVDNELIPLGTLMEVDNTPMDFRTSKKIGKNIFDSFKQFEYTGGYDHSFLIDKKTNEIEKIAELSSSNIKMEVFTDSIAVQFYSGNFIENNQKIGKEKIKYLNYSGICLETGFLPDAINQSNFKSPVLKSGTTYSTTTKYKFSF